MNITKSGAIPIGVDIVVLLDGCNKVVVIFISNVYDSEVMYNKAEGNSACDKVEIPGVFPVVMYPYEAKCLMIFM